MIVTFYSFKGGVGRSHSLMECAFELALKGQSVLVWDLDLEAPGLQKMPDLSPVEAVVNQGTLDLLLAFQQEYEFPQALLEEAIVSFPKAQLLEHSKYKHPLAGWKLNNYPGCLDFLLPAAFGSDDEYIGKFSQVRWNELFQPKTGAGPAFFHRVARLMADKYDYVLIDSRTGFTDLSALCALQLPDLVVIVLTFNQQNIHGVQRVRQAVTQTKDRWSGSIPVRLLLNLIPKDDELASLRRTQLDKLKQAGLEPHHQVFLNPRLLIQESLRALNRTFGDNPYQGLVADLEDHQRELEALANGVSQEKLNRAKHAPETLERLRRSGIPDYVLTFEDKVATLFGYRGFRAKVGYEVVQQEFDLWLEKEDDLFPEYVLVECKDLKTPVSQRTVRAFQRQVEKARKADGKSYKAMLVSRTGFLENAYTVAEACGIQLRTYRELLRSLVNLQPALDKAIRDYRGSTLEMMYVEQDVRLPDPRNPEGGLVERPLSESVHEWLQTPDASFLALLGDFGAGKTAFCRKLACDLALQAKDKPDEARYPILISLREAASTTVVLENILSHYFQSLSGQVVNPQAALHQNREGLLLLIFDGFDEILGFAETSRFIDILRQLLRAAEGQAKVLLTCRTHYFRDGSDESAALGAEPGKPAVTGGTQLYDELRERPGTQIAYLQEFKPGQIDHYLQKALPPPSDWRGFRAQIRDTYHLENLAERPFLLEMIVKSLPRIRERADTQPVTISKLYESYCEDWFDHTSFHLQLTREHRIELIEYLARLIWESPENKVHYDVLYERSTAFFRDVALTFHDKEKIDYEIRTALFLNRDSRGYYSFIHRSFLEFFLAGILRKGIRNGDTEVLRLKNRITREIAFFLESYPEAKQIPELAGPALSRPEADPLVKTNALLLLYFHAQAKLGPLMGNTAWKAHPDWPLRVRQAFLNLRPPSLFLDGAHLGRAELQGIDLSGASLKSAHLAYANLEQADLSGANLEQADLSFARLVRADLTKAHLPKTVLEHVQAREARFVGADLENAVLTLGSFVRSDFSKSQLEGVQPKYAGFMGARFSLMPTWLEDEWVGGVESEKMICLLPQGHQGGVLSLDWSPDGRWLASGGRDGKVRLWDASSSQLHTTLEGHRDWVNSVSWSPNGRWLASGGGDGTVRVWDAGSGQLRFILEGHQDPVSSVSWSPDGNWLASGGDDGKIRLWDTISGHLHAMFEGHRDWVNSISWSPNGQWLVSGGRDGKTRLWDAGSGQLFSTRSGHLTPVLSVNWSTNRFWIVSGGNDGSLWLDDSHQLQVAHEGQPTPVSSISWSLDKRWLASGGRDGTVRVWDTGSYQLRFTLEGHRDWVNSVSWSPDGHWLASGGDDGKIRLWDTSCGQLHTTIERHRDWVNLVSWSPDGRWLASGNIDGSVWLWETSNGQLRFTLEGHQDPVSSVSWSQDGLWLASGGDDNKIRLWETSNGQLHATLEGHQDWVNSVSWSPDGRWLASGSIDGSVRLWETSNGRLLATLEGHQDWVNSVSWSPDGHWLASGGDDGSVRLWKASNGQLYTTLEGHQDRVNSVSWSPDGHWLASGGRDGTVRVWDASDSQLHTTLEGHDRVVNSVSWSPDGHWLASGSDDGSVQMWDAGSGQLRATLEGNWGQVNSVSWSPDGRWLVSASAGDLLTFWDISKRTWLIQQYVLPQGKSLFITPDGYVSGSSDALSLLRFVDGWASYTIEDLPERISPERVQKTLERLVAAESTPNPSQPGTPGQTADEV